RRSARRAAGSTGRAAPTEPGRRCGYRAAIATWCASRSPTWQATPASTRSARWPSLMWVGAKAGRAPAAFAMVGAILIGAAGSPPAGAAPSGREKSIDSIVRFLQEHQQESGGFADIGKNPTQSISAWVTLALAAAGINPLNQIRTANGEPC